MFLAPGGASPRVVRSVGGTEPAKVAPPLWRHPALMPALTPVIAFLPGLAAGGETLSALTGGSPQAASSLW